MPMRIKQGWLCFLPVHCNSHFSRDLAANDRYTCFIFFLVYPQGLKPWHHCVSIPGVNMQHAKGCCTEMHHCPAEIYLEVRFGGIICRQEGVKRLEQNMNRKERRLLHTRKRGRKCPVFCWRESVPWTNTSRRAWWIEGPDQRAFCHVLPLSYNQ